MSLSHRYDNENETAVLSSPHINGQNKSSTFTVEVVTDIPQFDSLEAEWDKLAAVSHVYIFQLYFWLRTWWKHFGDKTKLHIVLVRHNSRLVGIAPMYIENYSFLKLYNFKYLRLIGSTIPQGGIRTSFYKYGISDYLDFIIHPDHEEEVADILTDHLESPYCLYDQAIFQDVPSDSFIVRRLVPGLEEKSRQVVTQKGDICPYIELPETTKVYLMSLDRKTRYKLRHSDRAVNKDHLFYIHSESSADKVSETLSNLISMHQQRWNHKGELGAFADSRYGSFILEVCKKAAENDKLRMYTAYSGSQCIAVNYFFEFRGRIYDYIKSFDDSHPLSKFRPGLAILFEIIKEAIKRHLPVVDLLRGDERYKLKLTSLTNSNRTVIFETPGGVNPIKKSYHKIDTFLFVNNQAFKRIIYLFKTGWGEHKKGHIRYSWNFLCVILQKVAAKILNKKKQGDTP